MPQINNLNLKRWKRHADVWTDSLWMIADRDRSGAHNGFYHGNFVPQIPHQTMLRYTRRGEVVLDTFLGSGTTLIECRRMGRHGIGVELIPSVAKQTQKRIESENNSSRARTVVVQGDSGAPESRRAVQAALKKIGKKSVGMIVMHPPYHDIIKFSRDRRDLCNAGDTQAFLASFGQVVENFAPLLGRGRMLILVIGDKYAAKQWVPLGFYTMQEVLKRGFTLKSLVVKNMEGNRAKRNQQNLWRYRALAGGFYVFKHEYVMIFEKQ